MTLLVQPPTDAQLAYIASPCEANGMEPPAAIHSSREASEIITALRTASYQPARYVPAQDFEERSDPFVRDTWQEDQQRRYDEQHAAHPEGGW